MADKIQNGQAEYGIIHVQEQKMREAGVGVFEASSSEAGSKRKKAPEPENKMESAPVNKAVAGSSSRKAKAKKAK